MLAPRKATVLVVVVIVVVAWLSFGGVRVELRGFWRRLETKMAEASFRFILCYADDICNTLGKGQPLWLLSECVSLLFRLRDPLGVFSRDLTWTREAVQMSEHDAPPPAG